MENQKLIFSEELLQLAEGGDPQAQYQVATCYHNGLGVTSNMAKAEEWYLKAANQAHTDAQYALFLCYLNSGNKEADKWLAAATVNGSKDAKKRYLARRFTGLIGSLIPLAINIFFFMGLTYLSPTNGFLKFGLFVLKIIFSVSVLKAGLQTIGYLLSLFSPSIGLYLSSKKK